jgi:hypothetical protein
MRLRRLEISVASELLRSKTAISSHVAGFMRELFLEQLWQGGRICGCPLPEVYGLDGRTTITRQPRARRHHCFVFLCSVVYSGQGELWNTATKGKGNTEAGKDGQRQQWHRRCFNASALSRKRIFNRKLCSELL